MMNSIKKPFSIPDTRPYPSEINKNDFLVHADTLLQAASPARIKLAEEQMRGELAQMLENNHYLGFSVALSLAPSAAHYRVLWQALIEQMNAQKGQIQWLALPVVLVCGANHNTTLSTTLPLSEIKAVFASNPLFSPLNNAHWLPFMVDGAVLSNIDAGTWFAAKEEAACKALFSRFQAADIDIQSGQSVHVLYAICYGEEHLCKLAARATGEMALPLMQVFQAAFNSASNTIFANPLHLNTPIAALCEGSAMRQRMACDVFIANAIRAIRLQHPRVGVVLASGEDGVLYIGLQTQEANNALPPQIFTWHLAAGEEIGEVVQNILDLLHECQVEHVRILPRVFKQENLPTYAQAINEGFNPFFDQQRTFDA